MKKARNLEMDALADRIRRLVAGDPRLSEKRMFGGPTFLLDGHILAGPRPDGRMLMRVPRDEIAAVSQREGAVQASHGTRIMTGFFFIEPHALETDAELRGWLEIAERAAAALPPK